MTEHVATCPHCPGFEVLCVSDAHRAKVQDAHARNWHGDAPPETDELCEALVAAHPHEREVIELAIETAAARNGGTVDPNWVRSLIPRGTTPQLVGAVYRVWKRRGRLVVAGENISEDKHGRNAGRKQPVYRLVEGDRAGVA